MRQKYGANCFKRYFDAIFSVRKLECVLHDTCCSNLPEKIKHWKDEGREIMKVVPYRGWRQE